MMWIRQSESGSFEGQAADLLLRDVCLSWLWWLNKSWVWSDGRSDGCYNDKTPFPLPLFDFVILNCRRRRCCSDFNARDDEFRPPPFISTPFPSSLTAGLSAIQALFRTVSPRSLYHLPKYSTTYQRTFSVWAYLQNLNAFKMLRALPPPPSSRFEFSHRTVSNLIAMLYNFVSLWQSGTRGR